MGIADAGRAFLRHLWAGRRVRVGLTPDMPIALGFELNTATGEWRMTWGPSFAASRPPEPGSTWDRPG